MLLEGRPTGVSKAWRRVARLLSQGTGGRMSRDAVVLGAANLVVAGLGLIQTVMVARWLGPAQYGLATLIIAYPNLWWGIFDAKAKESAVRFLAEFHEKQDRASALAMCKLTYAIDAACALLTCGLVLATLPWATRVVPEEALWLVALYVCGSVPFALVGTSRAALLTLGRFDLLATAEIVVGVLRTAIVLVLTFRGGSSVDLVIGSTIGVIVTSIGFGALGYIVIGRAWGGSWTSGHITLLRDRWREIGSFIVQNSFNVTLGTILSQMDVLLLGLFRSSSEVGVYKIAKTIAGSIDYIRGPIATAAYVDLARLWTTGQLIDFRRRVRDLRWRIGVPVGILCAGGALLVPLAVPAILGPAYGAAIGLAQVLMLGAAWHAAFFWLRVSFMAMGQLRPFLIVTTAASALMILGWTLSVEMAGAWGLALATIVVGVGQNTALVFLCMRQLRSLSEAAPMAQVGKAWWS
jgi:O-antigen/teichoic acid export membrane protein